MRGLGFTGYVAQGGDIGSFVSRLLVQKYDACKGVSCPQGSKTELTLVAVHVNMMILPIPEIKDKSSLSTFDKDCLERLSDFETEFAYRDEHATKPATIGIVVGSSPVALLAW
jgi:microsomal epoxide hydrolase